MTCPCLHSLMPPLFLTSERGQKLNKGLKKKYLRFVLFCYHYLHVLGAAFAGIVPPRQLFEEETAEDVATLRHSSSSFVEEVSDLQ